MDAATIFNPVMGTIFLLTTRALAKSGDELSSNPAGYQATPHSHNPPREVFPLSEYGSD